MLRIGKAWLVLLFLLSLLPGPAKGVQAPDHGFALKRISRQGLNLPKESDTVDNEQSSLRRGVSFVVLSHIYPLLFGGDPSDMDRMLNEIRNCSPDILILTGDIIKGSWNVREWKPEMFEDNEALRESLNAQWDYVYSVFERLNIPVWIAPGNHDISSYIPGYREITRDVFSHRVGEPFHAKRFGDYDFIFLNTVLSDAEKETYGLDEKQIQWLRGGIGSPLLKTGFVFLHHPLWYGGLQIQPGNVNMEASGWMQEVHPYLREKVKYVFAGDGGDRWNFLFYEIRDDVHYYVNGSGRSGVSFLHVVAGEDGIQVKPHFLDIQSVKPQRMDTEKNLMRVGLKKIVFVFHNKFFWLGVIAACIPLGLTIFILMRKTG